jgi:hypothetical protein
MLRILIVSGDLFSFCLEYKKKQKNQEPNMLPPTCRATPAFGSGHRAGTAQRVYVFRFSGADNG